MKKTLLYFTILLLFPLNLFAKNGAYIGINGNRSFADHRVSEIANTNSGLTLVQGKTTTNANNVGFGFEGGYRFDLKDGFFIVSELFFDQLNNNAADPIASNDPNDANGGFIVRQDRLILNYRYGAKLNLGYEFNEKFGAFVNAGIGVVDYDVPWNSVVGTAFSGFNSYGSTSNSAVYGIGAHYNLNEKLTIKASYDVQDLAIRYNLDGWRSSVELRVFKLGLNYNF